jgi:glycolate oxidase
LLPPSFRQSLAAIVGDAYLTQDPAALERYGRDSMNRPHPPDLVIIPGTVDEVSAAARLSNEARVPLVVRGAGTGYTGGAVPVRGGVVMSMERFNRILDIDQENLLAVVQPNVITGQLQEAVERVGLFYPPDPASLTQSAIGGNVAECAGGPRAFKYGTTKRYVLALQAVLPTGEVVRTGSKAVKNVVGYDLTQLLVGSEGTLAIITEIVVRLIPKPPLQATLRATFPGIREAVGAVSALLAARVIPAAIEIVDGECLRAVAAFVGSPLAPPEAGALLLIEVDGVAGAVAEEAERVRRACAEAGALEVLRATSERERDDLWRVRRDLSPSLKLIAGLKYNHDVVVPRGRVPQLYDLIEGLRGEFRLRIPCFGHAGDGNIHVNIMVDPNDPSEIARAQTAQRQLFEGVVALEGSISGEHGIGFAKAPYLHIELSPDEIALMKRVKAAFDPNGILNPGKIFPD